MPDKVGSASETGAATGGTENPLDDQEFMDTMAKLMFTMLVKPNFNEIRKEEREMYPDMSF